MSRNNKVWLNIPYDDDYLSYRHAIETVLWVFDLDPVIGSDLPVPDPRLPKLLHMIMDCSLGITDVLNGPKGLRTINMPFEHGIMWAVSQQHPERFHAPVLLCHDSHDIQVWFGDMNSTDPKAYGGDALKLIRSLREWILGDPRAFVVTRLTKEKASLISENTIIEIYKETLKYRKEGTSLKDVREMVEDSAIRLRGNGHATIGNKLIVIDVQPYQFPKGFRAERGFSYELAGRTFHVPFVLYTSVLRNPDQGYRVDSLWSPGQDYFVLDADLAKHRRAFLKEYKRSLIQKLMPNERVTRLESVVFGSRPPTLRLECKKLRRYDLIATNFVIDKFLEIDGRQTTLREQLNLNEEIADNNGIVYSRLANTIGVSLIVGNPKDSTVILSRRSRVVSYPFPQSMKVSAGGEVRPREWLSDGPDVFATAKRLAQREVGLLSREIGELRCIGLGRSVQNGIPEILFELTTNVDLQKVIMRLRGLDRFQNTSNHVVDCEGDNAGIISWITSADWSPQHLVCCLVYLLRHHKRVIKKMAEVNDAD